ncbi:hypothetical protein QE152_g4428 [Popillia japonica]|uniref:Uncharacterized protein n=1 Tax=Popillia japonica TaxID=7064 RepID=A0AAW1MZ26_POPJA
MQIRPERGETAYNFGIRCKNLLNLVLTKVKLAENNAQRRQIKIELHNDTVLQTYLRGIAHFGEIGHRVRFRNPENIETAMSLQTYLRGIAHFGEIGHRVRFRNPENIETAMSYVLEEENFNYFVKQPRQLYHQTDEINAPYQEEQQEEYYPTEETQWIEETQQEFEEDNYEHENYTSFMEESEITEEETIIQRNQPHALN